MVHNTPRGLKFPLAFVIKMLCRVSRSFDNLCGTFLVDSISQKNWDMKGK